MNEIHAEDSAAGAAFGWALNQIKVGKQVTRLGWNGKGQYIAMLPAKYAGTMTRAYIFIKTVDDDMVPWVASQTDLLSNDWVYV